MHVFSIIHFTAVLIIIKNLAERNETKNEMAIWQLKKRQKVLFTSNSNIYKYINVNVPQDLKKGHKKLMLVE